MIGGAQRLPNGDTLVTEGTNGRIVEVSPRGRVVWDFVNPHQGKEEAGTDPDVTPNRMFRAYRYAPTAPALAGKGLRGP